MSTSRRKTIEGWIDKAGSQLQVAKDHLESAYRCSEAIEAAQECVELSVKATLSLLGIEYKLKHKWDWEEFTDIAKQIEHRQILDRLAEQNLYHCSRLPRLLLLANLWGHFYLPAKYGFAQYLAPAQDLFEKQEAELAVKHAGECHRAASELRYLGEEKLAVLLQE
jgi:HEPN domain-containing protein